jgi:dynein heavy chain
MDILFKETFLGNCLIFRWSEAKILMVKENFFDDLVFYDKENLPDDIYNMLTKIVKFDTFHPSFVAHSSKAASSLCSWILAVYEYAKIARSQKTKLEQVKAYQELYNKVVFLFEIQLFLCRSF